PAAGADDTAAKITWPARDVSGVNTLLRHGLQPITVIAVRPARPEPGVPAGPVASRDESLVIREAGPADLDAAAEFEMAVIRYDAVRDARGVDTRLRHYEQLNRRSGPFWSRMGYRPLWTGWEVRPAASRR